MIKVASGNLVLCQLFRLVKMMTWCPYVRITGLTQNKLSSHFNSWISCGSFTLQMVVPITCYSTCSVPSQS